MFIQFFAQLPLVNFICDIVTWVSHIGAAFCLIGVILAGYSIATSGGDPEKLATAKKALLVALVGGGIAYFAKTFTRSWLSNFPCQ